MKKPVLIIVFAFLFFFLFYPRDTYAFSIPSSQIVKSIYEGTDVSNVYFSVYNEGFSFDDVSYQGNYSAWNNVSQGTATLTLLPNGNNSNNAIVLNMYSLGQLPREDFETGKQYEFIYTINDPNSILVSYFEDWRGQFEYNLKNFQLIAADGSNENLGTNLEAFSDIRFDVVQNYLNGTDNSGGYEYAIIMDFIPKIDFQKLKFIIGPSLENYSGLPANSDYTFNEWFELFVYHSSNPVFDVRMYTYEVNQFTLSEDSSIISSGSGSDVDLSGIEEGIQGTNDKLDDLNDNITNSDTSEAESGLSDFFGDFESNNHGLSGVITAPLEFIQSLLGHSCQPLEFPLPFVDEEVSLPCIKPIYQEYFGLFFNLYQVITTGIIAYAVGIRIFGIVKGLQDPQNDKIEVLKL